MKDGTLKTVLAVIGGLWVALFVVGIVAGAIALAVRPRAAA